MANNKQIDYQAIQGIVQWEVEKARVMLDDVSSYFGAADVRGLDDAQMLAIRLGYQEIAAKLALIGNILDNIETVFEPVKELAG